MGIDLANCEIHTPTDDERLPLYRWLMEVFPSDRPLLAELAERGDRFPHWPAYVLYSGSEILGSVFLAPVQVWLEGRPVDVLGIAWVATRAEYRRQGVATRLLRHALEDADRKGLPSVLFTSVPGVYEPLGYVAVPQLYPATTARELDGYRPRYHFGIHDSLSPTLVESMARLYTEAAPAYHGKVIRDSHAARAATASHSPYWHLYQTLFDGNPNARIVSCEEPGRVVGYVRAETEADRLLVSELCCGATGGGVAEALLGFVAGLATSVQRERITLALPDDHPAKWVLDRSGVKLRPEPPGASRETFMVRPAKDRAIGPLQRLQWPLCDKF